VLLLDGRLTFESSHDHERHKSAQVREMMGRIRAIADANLDPPSEGTDSRSRRTWVTILSVNTHDGRTITERIDTPRGTHENPISWDELTGKAFMALSHVLPTERIEDLVRWVRGVDTAASARELRPFLEAPAAAGRSRGSR
jgi:2-methylcitrate dehydratase PrpD